MVEVDTIKQKTLIKHLRFSTGGEKYHADLPHSRYNKSLKRLGTSTKRFRRLSK
jgi:hypothetical protein